MKRNFMSLTLDIPKEEYEFISNQAEKSGLSISEYIILCSIAQNDLLHISAVANQLRQLKYQLKSINNLITTEKANSLSTKKTYDNILSLMHTINMVLCDLI